MNYKKFYTYTKLKRWVKDHCEDVTDKYTNNEIENYKTPTREEGIRMILVLNLMNYMLLLYKSVLVEL